MSKWRQNGFVQDSDEDDDESQIETESQHSRPGATLERRVERVDKSSEQHTDTRPELPIIEQHGASIRADTSSPEHEISIERPINPPITPAVDHVLQREPPESPDPLQSSPIPKVQQQRDFESSQLLGSPAYRRSPIVLATTESNNSQAVRKPDGASEIFGHFGITPLSDDSENESLLSDPPSDMDLESPPPMHTSYVSPHRRTAVQVVISHSTALKRRIAEEETRRQFRQRKPIQVHPYVLEGERYRREIQSRGLKPVPREQSPQRRASRADAETQEKEFNPNESFSSSPVEPEIPVSKTYNEQVRMTAQDRDSVRHTVIDKRRRRVPASSHREQHVIKPRKLNLPATQIVAESSRTHESSPVPRDIWSVPPDSPPYSSSPLRNGDGLSSHHQLYSLLGASAPNLPTPSNSSTFQDEHRCSPESDVEPAPRSVRRKGEELRRTTRIVLSESSSDSEVQRSESGNNELKKVGKKIKGVLPASWLRIDRQAQERRSARAREEDRARLSPVDFPGPSEPQRGVAQRIARRISRPTERTSVSPSCENGILISDESEAEPEADRQLENVQNDFEYASALAAMFDDLYANDDDDQASMEHDKLPLFTLGGTGSKRKRQPKITESLGSAKRTKSSSTVIRADRPVKRISAGNSGRQKNVNSKKVRRSTLPAMGVMDMSSSPSGKTGKTPQFIKVAQRQARRRPDQARQSPSNKYIRLNNAQDTEDANATLLQWRRGALRPQRTIESDQQSVSGVPEVVHENAQLSLPQPTTTVENGSKQYSEAPALKMADFRSRKHETLSDSLLLFQRSTTTAKQSSARKKRLVAYPKSSENITRRRPTQFRTAQLEGDEQDLSPRLRTIAFEKALRHADQQFSIEQSVSKAAPNPQISRLLADDSTTLLSPPGNDIAELSEGTVCRERPPNKRRTAQKIQAQRVDIDMREYRQPSEPSIQQVFENVAIQTDTAEQEQLQPVLNGLGSFGTRYSTTFDVVPLKSDTYFHSSTFIGSDDLRRALSIGTPDGRDLDQRAGYCSISHTTMSIRCGPWDDDTYSRLCDMVATIWLPLDSNNDRQSETRVLHENAAAYSSDFLRSLVSYIHSHASFLDPIDRKYFTARLRHLLYTLSDRLHLAFLATSEYAATSGQATSSVRALSYLLVAAAEVLRISQHPLVGTPDRIELTNLIKKTATSLVAHVITKGVRVLDQFLAKNRHHLERETGVQNDEALVESTVICMHVLDSLDLPNLGYWDVVSKELSPLASKATHVQTFEKLWATTFTLLPFTEFDVSGIPNKTQTSLFVRDSWGFIRDILKRLFDLYPSTYSEHSSSLNGYVRANLARCHALIHDWHWRKPEQMLNVTLDFFGKMGLQPLKRETNSSSATFLQTPTGEGSLTIGLNDSSFLITLKCLALGLQGMASVWPEKKVRSFVIRRIPNHGRSYPKDQPLEEEALDALRNHHDLLCTLYWAAPSSCRPRLELIRNLVSHEKSHREACRLSVSAWTNLTAFQISNDEPYFVTKQFASWHKEIMHQTLEQYQLAKTEADDYLKSATLDSTTEVSAIMVRQTMERNQEQVIATLRDCIVGIRRAIQCAKDLDALASFLADAGIVHLLELPHLQDRRLVRVIRDVLALFCDYAKARKVSVTQCVSQQLSEESQDYGEFPDLEELENIDSEPVGSIPQQSGLGFVQAPLWRLLSNAFGAENPPDQHLLEDCVDTWILVANDQIVSGHRSWSYYIESFSQVSWKQLRQTEQAKKFNPYFLASLIECDSSAYVEHRHDILTSLLLCLVDRESLLAFQHRLLDATVKADPEHPLFKNLPFIRNEQTGRMDITAETLRSRRLAVLSSMLSNIRDDVHNTWNDDPTRVPSVKRIYSTMLKDLMTAMKSNYQQLQQNSTVTGAYVEFVQRIVQFLTQYTSEICLVLPFFTDSVAFPLPAADPTYVIGRLCGYVRNATDMGTAKQLFVFIQTVAQQAAADNHGPYLVHQLTTVLCPQDSDSMDRAALRSVFCQAIFPVYIEIALSSKSGLLLASPILQSLPMVLDTMIFDLRIIQPDSASSILGSIVSIAHAIVRGTEQLKGNVTFFQKPHILCALSHLFEAAASSLRLLDYVWGRTAGSTGFLHLPLVVYLVDFSTYVAQMVDNIVPDRFPSYIGDVHADSGLAHNVSLLLFCRSGVEEGLNANWSESEDTVWFGHGSARREAFLNIGTLEEEQAKLSGSITTFKSSLYAR